MFEGGRTRAICLDYWEKRDEALGEPRLALQIECVCKRRMRQQMENTTLDFDGDACRFACHFFFEKFRRVFDKRAAQGKNIKEERVELGLSLTIAVAGLCQAGQL